MGYKWNYPSWCPCPSSKLRLKPGAFRRRGVELPRILSGACFGSVQRSCGFLSQMKPGLQRRSWACCRGPQERCSVVLVVQGYWTSFRRCLLIAFKFEDECWWGLELVRTDDIGFLSFHLSFYGRCLQEEQTQARVSVDAVPVDEEKREDIHVHLEIVDQKKTNIDRCWWPTCRSNLG